MTRIGSSEDTLGAVGGTIGTATGTVLGDLARSVRRTGGSADGTGGLSVSSDRPWPEWVVVKIVLVGFCSGKRASKALMALFYSKSWDYMFRTATNK